MDKIDRHLIRLRSPDKNIRYDACKQLGVIPNLPPEAVTGLKRACRDPDPNVARAARRALLPHRKIRVRSKSQSDGFDKIFWNDYWIIDIVALEGTEFAPDVLVD